VARTALALADRELDPFTRDLIAKMGGDELSGDQAVGAAHGSSLAFVYCVDETHHDRRDCLPGHSRGPSVRSARPVKRRT
jgi:hypothetical protein